MASIAYPVKEEIDTRNSGTPEFINFNWLKIYGLDKLKAIIRKEAYSISDKRIYLFGRHDDCKNNGAQIFIHLFDLPTDKNELDRRFNFYKDQQTNFFLANRRKFDNSILNLSKIPSDFKTHQAFQTKDGRFRKRLVHLYEYEQIALLIIYSLDTNEFIENSFFKLFSENILIKP